MDIPDAIAHIASAAIELGAIDELVSLSLKKTTDRYGKHYVLVIEYWKDRKRAVHRRKFYKDPEAVKKLLGRD